MPWLDGEVGEVPTASSQVRPSTALTPAANPSAITSVITIIKEVTIGVVGAVSMGASNLCTEEAPDKCA